MNNTKNLLSKIGMILMVLLVGINTVKAQDKTITELYNSSKNPKIFKEIDYKLPFSKKKSKVKVEIIDNLAIFEGDVVLGDINKIILQNDAVINGQEWPNGCIPYIIDNNVPNAVRIKIESAINMIHQSNPTINLRLREKEQSDINYVRFFNNPSSPNSASSPIGMVGGINYIQIGLNMPVGSVVHEIFHTAGLFHTHTRTDRNNFISLTSAAQSNPNFNICTNCTNVGNYDYESIMHYGAFTGIICNPPTPYQCPSNMGQRTTIRQSDINGINFKYPNFPNCGSTPPPGPAANCSTPNPNFCPGNIFTNGNFEDVTGSPNASDKDIHLANGWLAPWGQGTVNCADLACVNTSQGGGVAVPPRSGAYGGMWILNSTNINQPIGDRREAMYNKLKTPITKNSGWYSFNFDITKGFSHLQGSVTIALYGVSNPNGIVASLGNQPTHFTPSNLNLFGTGNVVKLGTINTPANFNNSWSSQTLTFNTAYWDRDITHILVASDDVVSDVNSQQYVNFDNFCMTKTVPPKPEVEFNECNCMPLSTYEKVGSFFTVEADGNLPNLTYKLKYVPNEELKNLSNSWDEYIRNLYGLSPNTEVLIHQFIIYNVDPNTNDVGTIEQMQFISDRHGWPTEPTTWFSAPLSKNKKYILVHGIYYSDLVPYYEKCGWKHSRAFLDFQIGGSMRITPLFDNGVMMKRPILNR